MGDGTQNLPINGAPQVISQIMNNVLASAAEAEVGGLFINSQAACPLRTTLTKLGHTQPPTIIVTDNECAKGIANGTVKQKRSKAIDMRFYWIRDRVAQQQFQILWKKGADNLADYFTKHHPPTHHKQMRPLYLQETANTVTRETVTFKHQTKFKTTSTLRQHQGNQASQRSGNHNNRMNDSLHRRDEYNRNNQPWIEVKNKSHHGGSVAAQTAERYRLHQLTNDTQIHSVDHGGAVDDTGIHCEGVLNNNHSHTVTTSVPSVPHSETPFPHMQASNDISPCSKARLIGGPNTNRYWLKRLVQRPLHIRQ
jgi:hypothetical protein